GANTPCYRRYGRVSADNGVSWQTDDMVGDAMSPLPAQPDTTVQTVYEGDYDYSSANGTIVYTTWNDGRTLVNGTSQQDIYFDNNQLYTSANVSSNGNLQFVTSNIAYTNECLPSTTITGPTIFPFWDDLRTDGTSCTPGPCGIFTSTSGSAPNRIFNIEWRTI